MVIDAFSYASSVITLPILLPIFMKAGELFFDF